MTPEQLAEKILQALTALVDDGTITVDGGLPGELKVERPKNSEHGDYATNVAMQLGKRSGMPPRQFAELLAARLTDDEAITAVEIAGPGFINIRVAADAQGKIAASIVEAGPQYGSTDSLKGQAINLEFISANPTGPLHLGHTRWAAVGDALARVLNAAGAVVTREFYVNDRGAQMDKFGASLKAAAHGEPIPEDGYHGEYINDLAKQIVAEVPDITKLPEDEQRSIVRQIPLGSMIEHTTARARVTPTAHQAGTTGSKRLTTPSWLASTSAPLSSTARKRSRCRTLRLTLSPSSSSVSTRTTSAPSPSGTTP